MKRIVTAYTFNASAKTITFTEFTTLELERILLITNVTRNAIIYNFASTGGTVSTNVLTLSSSLNTTGMANTDRLQIFYDYLDPLGVAGTANTEVSTVQGISGGVPLPVSSSTLALESGNLASINTKLPSNLTVSATRLLVDGSGVTQPISLVSEAGYSSFRNTSLTNTPIAVKTTSGLLMGWNFINVNTATVYVKFYNLSVGNTVVGTSTPILTLAVPGGTASAPGIFFQECTLIPQEVFSTAITVICVSGLADNNTTAPTTPIHISARFK